MLIKGEGVPQNATAAVELYQAAAAQDNIRALNGLGYAYFNGQGVQEVRSSAYIHAHTYRDACARVFSGRVVFLRCCFMFQHICSVVVGVFLTACLGCQK